MELLVKLIWDMTTSAISEEKKDLDDKGQAMLFPKKVLGPTKKRIKITAKMVRDLLAKLKERPNFEKRF